MKAMVLTNPQNPLELKEVAIPEPGGAGAAQS